MEAIRLERVREDMTVTDRQIIKKLMACPYLEEELAGVYERGVRLPVERRAGKSKVPKTILLANAALDKELQKQLSLLDSAKRHHVSIMSWTQRQFFIRKMFDSQNNLRYTTRKGSALDFATMPNRDRDGESPKIISEIFECFVTSMAKAVKDQTDKKDNERATSVTICDTPIPPTRRRPVYSAPAARSYSNNAQASGFTTYCDTAPSSATRRIRSAGIRLPSAPASHWYSCLATKPWMLTDQHKASCHQRNGQGHHVACTRITSAARKSNASHVTHVSEHHTSTPHPYALTRHYSENTFDIEEGYAAFVMNKLPKVPCSSLTKWKSQRNRAIIRRILPTLPDRALQQMLELFGEGIVEQKQRIYDIARTLANQNALKDKRWKDLEILLESLQNE